MRPFVKQFLEENRKASYEQDLENLLSRGEKHVFVYINIIDKYGA